MDDLATDGTFAPHGGQLPSMIPIIDPVTEEQIGEIADEGAKGVDVAVERSRASFNAGLWHEKTPSDRAKILWRAADILERRADEIGAIDSNVWRESMT